MRILTHILTLNTAVDVWLKDWPCVSLGCAVEQGCEHDPCAKPNNHSTWPVQKDRAQRQLKRQLLVSVEKLLLQWHFLFNPRMEVWIYYRWRVVLEARAEDWATGQFKYRCRPHRVIYLAVDWAQLVASLSQG